MSIKIAMVLTVVGIMTLCLVAPNHAFAETACSLTLKADPGSGSLAKGESVEQKLSGTLTCGGTGLSGGHIGFQVQKGEFRQGSFAPSTDSSGNFEGPHFLVHPGDSFTVNAHYGGDSKRQLSAADYSLPIIMSTK